jgi:hypothetical protein
MSNAKAQMTVEKGKPVTARPDVLPVPAKRSAYKHLMNE